MEWTGSVTTTNWADNANWTGGAAPTGSNELTLRFGNVALTGTGNAANNDIGTFILNSIDFVNAGYALSGGDLQFQATSDAVNPTITVNVATTGYNQSIANNLILDNDLTIGGSGFGLLTLSGIVSGSGGLTVNHETVLSNANTFLGNVAVNADLHVQNSTALSSGVVTVGSGFKLITDGASTTTIANAIAGSGGLLVQRETILTGSNTFSGGVTALANVRVDASNNLGTGLVTLGGTGAGDVWLTVRQDAVNVGNNIVVNPGSTGDVYIQTLISGLSVAATTTFSGNITLNAYAKIHPANSLLTQVMSGVITGSGFQKESTGVLVLTNTNNSFGKFDAAGGTLQLDVDHVVGTATIRGGTLTGSGIVTANYYDFQGGDLNIRLANTGAIYQSAGSTLIKRADAFSSGMLVNVSGGTLAADAVTVSFSNLVMTGGLVRGTNGGVASIANNVDFSGLVAGTARLIDAALVGTRTFAVSGTDNTVGLSNISGGYIVKQGDGKMIITGSNSFAGLFIREGIVHGLEGNNARNTFTGDITVGDASTLTTTAKLQLTGSGASWGQASTTANLLINANGLVDVGGQGQDWGNVTVYGTSTGGTGTLGVYGQFKLYDNGYVSNGNSGIYLHSNSDVVVNTAASTTATIATKFSTDASSNNVTMRKQGAGTLVVTGATGTGMLTFYNEAGTTLLGGSTYFTAFNLQAGTVIGGSANNTLGAGGTAYLSSGGTFAQYDSRTQANSVVLPSAFTFGAPGLAGTITINGTSVTVGAATALTMDGGATVAFARPIEGAFAVSVTGNGTVILSTSATAAVAPVTQFTINGARLYARNTVQLAATNIINGGTLMLSTTLATGKNIVIGGSATLTMMTSTSTIPANQIAGSGLLTIDGTASTYKFSLVGGPMAFTGTMQVNPNGRLVLSATTAFTGQVLPATQVYGTLDIPIASAFDLRGVVFGTNTSTLWFSNKSSNFTGYMPTAAITGSLWNQQSTLSPLNRTLFAAGATYTGDGSDGGNSITGTMEIVGPGSLNIVARSPRSGTAIDAVIAQTSGSVALNISGGNRLFLNRANSYDGGTVIGGAGSFVFATTSGALGTTSAVVNTGATLTLMTSNAFSNAAARVILAGGGFGIGCADTTLLNQLDATSTGALYLNFNGTYSGTLDFTTDTLDGLTFGGANTAASGTSVTFNGAFIYNNSWGNFNLSSAGVSNGATMALVFSPDTANSSYNGALVDGVTARSLTIDCVGGNEKFVTLTNSNSYTGGTYINKGAGLGLTNAGAISTGTVTFVQTSAGGGNAWLKFSGVDFPAFNNNMAVAGSALTVVLQADSLVTVNGNIDLLTSSTTGNSLTVSGSGLLKLVGSSLGYCRALTVQGAFQPVTPSAIPAGTGGAAATQLNIDGGRLVLDAGTFSWSQFTSKFPTYGTGVNQFQINNGGGFAAAGTDLVIDTVVAGTAIFDRNFSLGSVVKTAGGAFAADQSVIITPQVLLTTNRTIYVASQGPSVTGAAGSGIAQYLSGGIGGAGIPIFKNTGAHSTTGNAPETVLGGANNWTGTLTSTANNIGVNVGPGGMLMARSDGSVGFVRFANPSALPSGNGGQAALIASDFKGGNSNYYAQGYLLTIASGTNYVYELNPGYKFWFGTTTQGDWQRPSSFGATSDDGNGGTATFQNSTVVLFRVSSGDNGFGMLVRDGELVLGSSNKPVKYELQSIATYVTGTGTVANTNAVSPTIYADGINVAQIDKRGAGTLTLDNVQYTLPSGTNLTIGGTDINAMVRWNVMEGTLKANAASSLGLNFAVVGTAGTLELLGNSNVVAVTNNGVVKFQGAAPVIYGLSGSGNTILGTLSGSTMLTVTNDGNISVTNNISEAALGAGFFAKQGNGILTFAGSNSFTGGITVYGGGVKGNVDQLTAPISLQGASAELAQATDATFSKAITGSGTFTKSGSGIVTLSAASSFTGTASVTAGGVKITTATLPNAYISLSNNSNVEFAQDVSGSFGGIIDGNGSVSKSGTGAVTLTGTHVFSGTASVLAGKLIVNGSLATGGYLSVAAGATVAGNGVIARTAVVDGSIEVGNAGVGTLSMAALTLNNGSAMYFELGATGDQINMTGALTINATSTLNLSYLGGFVNTADYTLMTYTSATGLENLSYAALPSNFTLVNSGTQLILDYTAPVVLNVDATWNVDADGLWMADSNWTPSAPKTADSTAMFGSVVTTNCLVTVDAPVTLASMTFDNANSYTIAGSGITLSGTAVGIAVTNGSHTISAPVALTAATPVTVQAGAALTMGDISGSSDLTKAGAGTLKLVGLVTNSGITNVNAGTLIVNGTFDVSASALNIGTSCTLGGNGTINRPVVAAASAIIAPGESIGTLSAASVSMAAGSLLDIQITDGSADRLAVAGTFDVAGDLNVTYSTSTVVASTQTYSVATFASVNGAFANVTVDAQYIGHNIGDLYIAKGMDADSYDVTVKPFMAGDANLDGQVKIGDLVTLAQHWNQASGATWFDGDANGDGQIKIGDLVALAQNWNKTVTAGGAVPEPLTLTVLGLGGLAVLRRRSGK